MQRRTRHQHKSWSSKVLEKDIDSEVEATLMFLGAITRQSCCFWEGRPAFARRLNATGGRMLSTTILVVTLLSHIILNCTNILIAQLEDCVGDGDLR